MLFNFGTSLLSLVRMKLQTSTFAGGLRVRYLRTLGVSGLIWSHPALRPTVDLGPMHNPDVTIGY